VIRRGGALRRVVALAALASGFGTAGACGQKGDPRPPLRLAPGALADIAVRRIDDRVEVRFTVPAANEDGSTPSAIERILIYAKASAAAATLPDAAAVQVEANLIGQIDVRRDDDAPAADAAARSAAASRPGPGEAATFVDTGASARAASGAAVLSYVLTGVVGNRRRPSARFDVPMADAPAAPTNVTLTFDERVLTLSWQAAADQTFRVYDSDATGRVTATGAEKTAPIAATSLTSPVKFGVERCFVVRAVRVTGVVTVEGSASPPVCKTPEDTFPPPAPTRLSGVFADGVVTLVWTGVEAADLAGYLVLRGDAAGATLTPLSEPVTGATYTDRTVTPGATYWYEVVAVDSSPRRNRSAPSNQIAVTARD
jgi:hypothetical protein